jgi:hypothetical protein
VGDAPNTLFLITTTPAIYLGQQQTRERLHHYPMNNHRTDFITSIER